MGLADMGPILIDSLREIIDVLKGIEHSLDSHSVQQEAIVVFLKNISFSLESINRNLDEIQGKMEPSSFDINNHKDDDEQ